MATLKLAGISTGINTEQLVTQLLAVEKRTLNLYTARKKTWDDRKNAINTLETKLSSFRNAVRAISDSSKLKAFSAMSSDSDAVTAEASFNSFEGNHNVVIKQLAASERWVQTAGMKYKEDYVGEGTFIYSYKNKETSITTTEKTTLEELVGLINNDAHNSGITASILYYNKAYHLVLNGNDAGTDYRISVNSSNTQVLEAASEFTYNNGNATLSTRIIDLDQFGDNALEGGEVFEITGTDHSGNAIAQVNLSITSNTKMSHLIDEINNAFEGMAKATFENGKIVLTDLACGSSGLSINISYNANGSSASLSLPEMSILTEGGSAAASLSNFNFSDFTQTQAAQDSLIKVDGFPAGSAVPETQTLSRSVSPASGTYTITYEGQTTSEIAYDADISEIQAAIDALSTVNKGDITVAGSTNGLADGNITFTFKDTLGDVSMLSVNGANLSPGGTTSISETMKGVPSYISRSSNTIDDVIHGVTLHLHDTTDETGKEITLTRNIESVKTKVQAMVEAYNQVVSYIKENSSYDATTKQAGVLMADYTVTSIKSQIRTPLIVQTSGFIKDIDSFLIPAQIGFELDKNGKLSLDMNAFDEAIAKDYMSVLALIGADKSGSSNSNTIKYYGASSKYTTAGSYDVQVTVSGGAITSARIKLAGESSYRNAVISGNTITGISTFDKNGDPVNPENSLLLSVDLCQDGTFSANVRVRQGFAGAMEDTLDKILKTNSGSIVIDRENIKDQIEMIEDRIELEEYRLEKKEKHLTERFSRLEKTLTLLQNQMAALGYSS